MMRDQKFALIVLNGCPPSLSLVDRFWSLASVRICADGAFNSLRKYGRYPDVVIGDMDSIKDKTLVSSHQLQVINIPEQNSTDGDKAVEYCKQSGCKRIIIIGAFGKRTDHLLYNIGLLKKSQVLGIEAVLYDDYESVFMGKKKIELSAPVNTTISILPIFGTARIKSTQGLRYPMTEQTLSLGDYSSISNEFSEENATIEVGSGEVLITISESLIE